MGPQFGGFLAELPQKISGEKIVFAAQQLYKKIRFPCFVVLEKKSAQKLGRKKKGKKRKKRKKRKKGKKLHRGQKWVGWDERVS